jgi:23S rRNA pseudouridine1911/1915/1917 synthase
LEPLLNIVNEDSDLLVVNKPADLVCHPTKGDEYSSLISRARLYLQRQSPQAGAPHLIHRLDRETSGLVLLAKNPVAARELGKVWETREVRKEYLAIVHGHVAADTGVIDAPLGRDEHSRVAIKDCVRPDGAPARTEFGVLRRFERTMAGSSPQPFTLLQATPLTGRKHQIRLHAAHLGHPIVGDKLYGGDEDVYLALVERRLTDEHRKWLILPNHALHAARLRFTWRGCQWDYQATPEPWFAEFAR